MQKRHKKHVWPSILSPLVVLGLAVGLCAELALPQNSATPASTATSSTTSGTATQAQDPGVRQGPGAGGPLQGLAPSYGDFFTAALARFQEVDSVSGTVPNESGSGLGPRFNSNSCASCHAFPAVGGTSPATNPQVAMATLDGARNSLPEFITIDGPVREARFIRNPNGTADGGVHDLFVITGRVDAKACGISQPDFGDAIAGHNVIFRIPTPLFGAGLVESITDDSIVDNASNSASVKASVGISGQPNRSGNDGTVTRFGWKAQNKSLLMFAGEAYNVEQGVTNELFPNERDDTPGCVLNPLPEDSTNLTTNATYLPSGYSSDIVNFAMFARLSAAPTPAPATTVTSAGAQVFGAVGCNLCHTPSLKTDSTFLPTGQTNVTVNAFSDFLLHNMGTNLADNVSQGAASGSQFRTAPLWGLGQRIFFLHDGRTRNLVDAIEEHRSQGSEANQVINNFNQLSQTQAQALLMFLRSL